MPKTVLIVEDNALNMKLFRDLLEANGYKTLQAGDGGKALKMAENHRPDLIIMDIRLPKMSGLEAAHRIKSNENIKHIPIIAVIGKRHVAVAYTEFI